LFTFNVDTLSEALRQWHLTWHLQTSYSFIKFYHQSW